MASRGCGICEVYGVWPMWHVRYAGVTYVACRRCGLCGM